ncbi:Protein of unknown function [Gryllus bimaculatus]|nr:Protein of unknown function [Gryllus bimaculatus]
MVIVVKNQCSESRVLMMLSGQYLPCLPHSTTVFAATNELNEDKSLAVDGIECPSFTALNLSLSLLGNRYGTDIAAAARVQRGARGAPGDRRGAGTASELRRRAAGGQRSRGEGGGAGGAGRGGRVRSARRGALRHAASPPAAPLPSAPATDARARANGRTADGRGPEGSARGAVGNDSDNGLEGDACRVWLLLLQSGRVGSLGGFAGACCGSRCEGGAGRGGGAGAVRGSRGGERSAQGAAWASSSAAARCGAHFPKMSAAR